MGGAFTFFAVPLDLGDLSGPGLFDFCFDAWFPTALVGVWDLALGVGVRGGGDEEVDGESELPLTGSGVAIDLVVWVSSRLGRFRDGVGILDTVGICWGSDSKEGGGGDVVVVWELK